MDTSGISSMQNHKSKLMCPEFSPRSQVGKEPYLQEPVSNFLKMTPWDKGETELWRSEPNELLPNFPKGILTCGTNLAVFGIKATFK